MNKSAVMSHFSKIIDNMIDNSLFFNMYFQTMDNIEDVYGSCDDEAVPENINIHFGATRGCIVDDYYDYVVKFDITGEYMGSSCCDRECEIYARAKELNLDNYFAEVEFLGFYTRTIMFYDAFSIARNMDDCYYYDKNFDEEFIKYEDRFGDIHPITISIPLYGYRKASAHWDSCSREESKKYEQTVKSISSPMYERNLSVAVDFVREYGVEAYYTLTDFMYEEDINDLHGGNIGDIDGKMCFIDYSGFHE